MLLADQLAPPSDRHLGRTGDMAEAVSAVGGEALTGSNTPESDSTVIESGWRQYPTPT